MFIRCISRGINRSFNRNMKKYSSTSHGLMRMTLSGVGISFVSNNKLLNNNNNNTDKDLQCERISNGSSDPSCGIFTAVNDLMCADDDDGLPLINGDDDDC